MIKIIQNYIYIYLKAMTEDKSDEWFKKKGIEKESVQ